MFEKVFGFPAREQRTFIRGNTRCKREALQEGHFQSAQTKRLPCFGKFQERRS
jgi:hypothetical protein